MPGYERMVNGWVKSTKQVSEIQKPYMMDGQLVKINLADVVTLESQPHGSALSTEVT